MLVYLGWSITRDDVVGKLVDNDFLFEHPSSPAIVCPVDHQVDS